MSSDFELRSPTENWREGRKSCQEIYSLYSILVKCILSLWNCLCLKVTNSILSPSGSWWLFPLLLHLGLRLIVKAVLLLALGSYISPMSHLYLCTLHTTMTSTNTCYTSTLIPTDLTFMHFKGLKHVISYFISFFLDPRGLAGPSLVHIDFTQINGLDNL